MKWWLVFCLTLFSCARAESSPHECVRSDDCHQGLCVRGECLMGVVVDAGTPVFDDDASIASPADDNTRVPGPCADAVPPTPRTLVVNEVLVNVPAGPEGDANADGVRDARDDEFVELANRSDAPIDLTGVRILNGERLRFWFEPLCLLPRESVVVFGGGTVGSAVPGNAVISDTSFGFSNDGGTITVTAPTGSLATVTYDRSPPESLTLAPQLDGDRWVAHGTVSPLPFSPGRCADGADFATGCPQAEPDESSDAGTD